MRESCKWLGQLLLSLSIACAFGYGFHGFTSYALPLHQGQLRQARASQMADETEVLLNGAAQSYEQGRLAEAVKVLESLQERLVDKGGRYAESDRFKLERMYFLLGKSYHRLKKKDKALESYRDALRFNPNHRAAKYNLEMLDTNCGGGSGADQQPANSKPKPKL